MKIIIGNRAQSGYRAMYFFSIMYRICLDVAYTNYISKIYDYAGFDYTFNIGAFLLSWVLLLLCFPILRWCSSKGYFSDVIILFLVYLSYIPFTTMVAYFKFPTAYIIANTVYWLVLFLACRFFPKTRSYYQLKTKSNDLLLQIVGIGLSLVVIYISWRYSGFRFTINLTDVYMYRAEARSVSMPTLLSYLFGATKAVMPVLLVYSLSRKKYFYAVYYTAIQILSFSINGSKTVLFSTALAILFYFFYNHEHLKKIPYLMTGISVIALAEADIWETFFMLNYFIRRVFFLPNRIGALYFDYFTKNEPDYYRASFLRLFGFKSPYGDISHTIGEVYFDKVEMSANNGLISDAIANLGIAGIVIMPVILILILRTLDKCAYGIDKKIYISTAAIFAMIILSSFLSTVLLTHGLLLLGIVLLLIQRKTIESE